VNMVMNLQIPENGGEFINELSDCQLLKNVHAHGARWLCLCNKL
jgi:hypothetical protein